MPLRYRDGKPLWSRTLQTVLRKRPTRVLVVGDPAARPPEPVAVA
jgi:hypothetical protein